MLPRGRRLFATAAAVSGAAGVVAYAADPSFRSQVRTTGGGFVRFGRTFFYGSLAAADYKFVLGWEERARTSDGSGGKKSEGYKALRKVVDKRNAVRMLHVCKVHGSFYTKLGQYMSTLNYSLPAEYTDTLAELQDRAPFRPWADMAAVVEEDLGAPPSEIFRSIDEAPIAAASLAQVHRAVTKDGQTVAVKIQYPDLRNTAANDLAALHVCFRVLEAFFPEFGYTWLFPDFRQALANEVDFLQEARNAERVAAQFADDRRIHIPAVRRDLTTDRVLTMEFIEGAKANDVGWMRARGIDPKEVAKVVTRFFAEQVHEKGMVHTDPHPGNLMIRASPQPAAAAAAASAAAGGDAKAWQLVVLDHGMYRRLTPAFRSAYCRLWRALLLQDADEGEAAVVQLGLRADEYDAMSLMLTMRRARSSNRLGARISKEEAFQVYDKYKEVTAADVNVFLQRLPRDLLFVSRNANLVRSLNMTLGGTTRDRFAAHGRAAVKGLVLSDALKAAGLDLRGAGAAVGVGFVSGGQSSEEVSTGTGARIDRDAVAHALSSSSSSTDAGAAPASASSSAGGAELVSSSNTSGAAAEGSNRAIVQQSSSSLLASFAALLGASPPPRRPVTYEAAIAAGQVVDNPTEFEVLASRRAGDASKEGSRDASGRRMAPLRPLGVRARTRVWLSSMHLEARLAYLDALFALGAWWTGGMPESYVSPHEADALAVRDKPLAKDFG